MTGELLAKRGNLFGRDRARTVPPFTPLVRENISNLLVGQCLVPWLHHRGAEFLAFDGDWALQTLKDNHRRPTRATSCTLRLTKSRAAQHRREVPVFRAERRRAPGARPLVRRNPFPGQRRMLSGVSVLEVPRSLRCYFAGAGDGAGDAADGAADLTSFRG